MIARTGHKKYLGFIAWSFVFIFLPVNTHAQVKSWSTELARTLMARFADPNSYPYKSWSYSQGFMLEGLVKLRNYTGDKDSALYKYILRYVNEHVDASGNTVSSGSMDDMMPGALVCWAYGQTKKNNYKIAADKIRAAFNGYPTTSDSAFWHCKWCDSELWIDGVFMGEMFLVRYAQYIGDSAYCFNTAARHLLLVYKHLLKPGTHLLYHAWDEDKDASWANKTTGLSSEVWSEGLGWYAMMAVEALEAMPAIHPKRDSIVFLVKDLAEGLKIYQDTASGCWWDVVDKGGQAGNFTDESGSAMFTYMLQKGIELGVLDKTVYGPIVAKAYAGLVKKAKLNGQNLVDISDACDGVSVQNNYGAYVNFRRSVNAKEGVAAFLWATGIVEKPGKTDTGKEQHFITKKYSDARSAGFKVYDFMGRCLGSFNSEAAFFNSVKNNKNFGAYFAKEREGKSKKIIVLNAVTK